MYLSDKFLYVDLPKTGTVSVRNWLRDLEFTSVNETHHRKPTLAQIESSPLVFGTVRDPWSYYLSLWTYGVARKNLSGMYLNLTRFRMHKSRGWNLSRKSSLRSIMAYPMAAFREDYKKNLELYADQTDTVAFGIWLKKILKPSTAVLFSGSYYGSGLHQVIGYYSYLYVLKYCLNEKAFHSAALTSIDDVLKWYEQQCYVQEFLHTHTLEPDFRALIEPYLQDGEKLDSVISSKKQVNRSRPSGSSITDFYTEELVGLVAEREKLLIQKFGYDFKTIWGSGVE